MSSRAMSSAARALAAVHEPAKKMFTVSLDGSIAKLTYEKGPGVIDLQHTVVSRDGCTIARFATRPTTTSRGPRSPVSSSCLPRV